MVFTDASMSFTDDQKAQVASYLGYSTPDPKMHYRRRTLEAAAAAMLSSPAGFRSVSQTATADAAAYGSGSW